jgi:hypothetical protein
MDGSSWLRECLGMPHNGHPPSSLPALRQSRLDRDLRSGYLMNSFRSIEVKGSCPLSVVSEGWVMVIP